MEFGTHLVAGRAPGLQRLGVMPSAVQLTLPVEVNEIHEQLLAHATREARRVPAGIGPSARREHTDIATRQALLALQHREQVMMKQRQSPKRRKFIPY